MGSEKNFQCGFLHLSLQGQFATSYCIDFYSLVLQTGALGQTEGGRVCMCVCARVSVHGCVCVSVCVECLLKVVLVPDDETS